MRILTLGVGIGMVAGMALATAAINTSLFMLVFLSFSTEVISKPLNTRNTRNQNSQSHAYFCVFRGS